jgi:hypothetical protein
LPAEELETFVFEADLVKFAKHPAPATQCEEALGFAYELVKRTPLQPLDAGEGLAQVRGAGAD